MPLRGSNMKKHFLQALPFAAVVSCALSTQPAFACGGFFCDNNSPVNQAAERIIFAMDGEQVTQIVEVMYEGPAESFSWVLPVPGTPTPGVSSVQAFDRLQQATNPTYQLRRSFESGCDASNAGDGDSGGDGDGDGDGDGPSVTVIDSGSVGPFNYETISVDAADEDPGEVAVAWLTENGYDPGPRAAEVLGPYLQNGLNLIAFRLQKGKSAGAIRPISLAYDASTAAIPIRPTAVAANDDMPILVWVLGEDRAVSTNYFDLQLNELLIDWFNPGPTYNNVVIAAADEAGGQGFVTELAGSTEGYSGQLLPEWEWSWFQEFTAEDDVETVLVSATERFALFDGFADVVAETLPLRDGFSVEEFLSCPYCYFHPGVAGDLGLGGAPGEYDDTPIPDTDPIFTIDLAAFLNGVEEQVYAPLAETAALFDDFSYVTRFYTTMSADEMTLDPVFEFNPDLEDVSNIHIAEQVLSCDDNSWTVELADGTEVRGTGTDWPYALGDEADLPANIRVVQFSTSGPGTIVTDNSEEIESTNGNVAGRIPSPEKKNRGCSLEEAPADKTPWAYLLGLSVALLGFVRRRSA
jgi:hypothetical protein